MNERLVLAMDGSTHVSTAALLAPHDIGVAAAAAAGVFDSPGAVVSRQAPRWRVLAERGDADGRGQARALLRQLDDMLRETGHSPEDLAAIVVGSGPGTFTGVRIAVATARALALALDIPIVGVSTLSALAARVARAPLPVVPDVIVPVVDARRAQLFYGVYRRAERSGEYVRALPFGVCDRGALLSAVGPVPGETLIVGDVAAVDEAADGGAADGGGPGSAGSSGRPRGSVSFLPLAVEAKRLVVGQEALREPEEGASGCRLSGWLAGALAEPGGTGSGKGRPGDPGTPEAVKPIYVRAPDADIHITKMRDPWAEASQER
jgi:tRNA threonylcarbamoyl adenosine modification protein YeaZ